MTDMGYVPSAVEVVDCRRGTVWANGVRTGVPCFFKIQKPYPTPTKKVGNTQRSEKNLKVSLSLGKGRCFLEKMFPCRQLQDDFVDFWMGCTCQVPHVLQKNAASVVCSEFGIRNSPCKTVKTTVFF